MSALDVIRSFAESRERDEVIAPGITYRNCRDLMAEIELLKNVLKELYEVDLSPRNATHGEKWQAALRKAEQLMRPGAEEKTIKQKNYA